MKKPVKKSWHSNLPWAVRNDYAEQARIQREADKIGDKHPRNNRRFGGLREFLKVLLGK